MLKGKRVDLRIVEHEDVATWNEWFNDPEFIGPYLDFPRQHTVTETEKSLVDLKNSAAEMTRFLVLTKDGRKVGMAAHYNASTLYGWLEIGFGMLPGERGKGYAAEAAQMLVDYLFLTRDIERVGAVSDVGNLASQAVLVKAGMRKEGEVRKAFRQHGQWVDCVRFGILREEWKRPHVLRVPDALPEGGPRAP